jgi:hypothetical protein
MPADLVAARYLLNRELARSATFAVYDATDHLDDLPTGIAVRLESDRFPATGRRSLGHRLGRVAHPHVVEVLDHGVVGSREFVAFRRPPRNLADEISRTPSASTRIAGLGADLSAALARLHRFGVRSGSLHPGHVGLEEDGSPRLSPWPLSEPPSGWGGPEAWTAPEGVAGSSPTVASDIWSLGAVLLSGLVGVGPHHLSAEGADSLADHLRHSADPALIDVIGRSMAGEPDQRFASAHRMGAALRERPVAAAGGVAILGARARHVVRSPALRYAVPSLLLVALATLAGVGLNASTGSSDRLAACQAKSCGSVSARRATPDHRAAGSVGPVVAGVPAAAIVPNGQPVASAPAGPPADPPTVRPDAAAPASTPTTSPSATPTMGSHQKGGTLQLPGLGSALRDDVNDGVAPPESPQGPGAPTLAGPLDNAGAPAPLSPENQANNPQGPGRPDFGQSDR